MGHCDGLTTVTAEMGLSGRVGTQRLRGRLQAGFGPSGALRLEAIAPFGAPFFVLAGRDGKATLLLPRDGRVLRDAPPQAILDALAGLDVAPDDLRAWLAGCPAADGEVAGAREYDGGWLSVDLPDGRKAWFRKDTSSGSPWRLVAVTKDDGFTVEFAEHTDTTPRRVRLRRAASGTRPPIDVRLALSQVETNATLPDQAFEVDVPRDAVEITLDDLRASGPLRDTTGNKSTDADTRGTPSHIPQGTNRQ